MAKIGIVIGIILLVILAWLAFGRKVFARAQLKEGWNTVIYHGTPQRAEDALAPITGYVSVMYSYNEETGLWDLILGDTILETGATYSIKVTQDCALPGFSIKEEVV